MMCDKHHQALASLRNQQDPCKRPMVPRFWWISATCNGLRAILTQLWTPTKKLAVFLRHRDLGKLQLALHAEAWLECFPLDNMAQCGHVRLMLYSPREANMKILNFVGNQKLSGWLTGWFNNKPTFQGHSKAPWPTSVEYVIQTLL